MRCNFRNEHETLIDFEFSHEEYDQLTNMAERVGLTIDEFLEESVNQFFEWVVQHPDDFRQWAEENEIDIS